MHNITDHLEKLPVFLEVVRLGSIRAASKTLGMSQPAVSRTIQILEDSVAQRLLVRGQSGVQLTDYGQKLAILSQKIKKEVEQFEFESTEGEKEVPRMKIGTYESLAVYFFPGFLSHLSQNRTPVNVDLLTAGSDQLIEYLKRNIVDVVLSVNTTSHSTIYSKKLFDDYYSFYHSPSMEVSDHTPIIHFPNAKDLTGKKVSSYIKDSVFKKHPNFICESFEPIRALGRAGLGLAVLPTRVADQDLRSGELVKWNSSSKKNIKFGKHSIFFSYLKHRRGDSHILWFQRTLEHFEK